VKVLESADILSGGWFDSLVAQPNNIIGSNRPVKKKFHSCICSLTFTFFNFL
jgi:hypothetical protein